MAPHLGVPAAPLDPGDTAKLPTWLSVETTGRQSVVTLEPERYVKWTLRYGPHGLTDKVVTVGGAPWTHSRFRYSATGHLSDKTVTGPGLQHLEGKSAGTVYRTDSRRRIVERFAAAGQDPSLRLRHSTSGVTVEHRVGDRVVRRDRYDRAGRRLRIDVGDAEPSIRVRFLRDAKGRLKRVTRRISKKSVKASWDAPESWVRPEHLRRIPTLTSRGDVLLLLGAPHRHSVSLSDGIQHTEDDYAEVCWINDANTLVYDAAGVFKDTGTSCICGFCVAAEQVAIGPEATAWDIHWRNTTWVRLSTALGEVDVTADHRVITPSGPRPAGALRVGDLARTAGGPPTALLAIEVLAVEGLKAGANVQTPSGTFAAGGLLYESEQPRVCP